MVGRQHVHGSRGIWNKGVNPKRKSSVSSAMELDCHLTQKPKRNTARSNPGGQPKTTTPKVSKAERKAENVARKRSREASKDVIVEHRVAKKSLKRSAEPIVDESNQPSGDAEQKAAKRVRAIQNDIKTTKERLAALKTQLHLAMEKLKAAQAPSKPVKRGVRRRKRKSNSSMK